MINIELEKEIIQYVKAKKNGIQWRKLPEIYEKYLLQRYDDNISNNPKESYLRIIYNIEKIPTCPICGKPVKYENLNSYPYSNTCKDKYCIVQLRLLKSNKTKLEKYGDEKYNNYLKIKKTKLERYGDENFVNHEKAKQTKLERYGDENFVNSEKTKQTCLKKYGVTNGGSSKKALEKIKNTCLERYGVKSSWEIPQTIEKSKKTKIERYGNENFVNPEKTKQTCLERYGVSNPFKVIEIQEKYKQTCLERYGVNHNWKIPEEHLLTNTKEANEKKKNTSLKNWNCEYPSQSKEIREKVNLTLKENNSFNKSKGEEICYSLLSQKYKNIIRQYNSELYPFNCDFYIPEIDTYIEYNGSHYHHSHPFDENNINDLNELKKLQNKANNSERHKLGKKSQYDIIIYTWTILDVKKRNIAKENNLNFIEFWNINELKKWLLNK